MTREEIIEKIAYTMCGIHDGVCEGQQILIHAPLEQREPVALIILDWIERAGLCVIPTVADEAEVERMKWALCCPKGCVCPHDCVREDYATAKQISAACAAVRGR